MAEKILIVEDDGAIVDGLAAAFASEGFEVECAANGRLGLERARSGKPSLVILDIMLPGMSGYELCSRLRADPRFQQTPILAFTAMTRRRETDLARQAGANDVIVKPIQADELLNRVQSYLGPAGA